MAFRSATRQILPRLITFASPHLSDISGFCPAGFAGHALSTRSAHFQLLQRLLLSTAVAAEEPVIYRLDIVTGDVRGAGTHTPAVVRLFGDEGESTDFIVGDDNEAQGFDRAATKVYEVDVGRHLGDLRRLLVQQMEVGASEVGSGWFLDHIMVTGPKGRTWRFPCNAWLGKSDAGDLSDEQMRSLVPVVQYESGPHLSVSDELEGPLSVATSAVVLPHPEKVAAGMRAVIRKAGGWGGEDAYFVARGRNGVYGLGVSDGVYSWKERGIDSGLFSRGLMDAARDAVEAGATHPLAVMRESEASVLQQGLQGSATCCIVLLDTMRGQLMSANVGDSGFAVIGRRPYDPDISVKFQTPQQEHMFGCPYQLGHEESADNADDAMLLTLPVASGDVIILGSDGLWDNVAIDVLLAEVKAAFLGKEGPPQIVRRLTNLAFNNSIDKDKETPYSLGATEAFDMVYSGGKSDDITIAVAVVE